jgi:hypothetical protein
MHLADRRSKPLKLRQAAGEQLIRRVLPVADLSDDLSDQPPTTMRYLDVSSSAISPSPRCPHHIRESWKVIQIASGFDRTNRWRAFTSDVAAPGLLFKRRAISSMAAQFLLWIRSMGTPDHPIRAMPRVMDSSAHFPPVPSLM